MMRRVGSGWAGRRRIGRTVALLGGDGAGKSTIAQLLVEDPELHFTAVYMGPSLDSASHLLPTSRVARWLKRVVGSKRSKTKPTSDTAAQRRRRTPLPRLVVRSVGQYSEVVHRELRVWVERRRGLDVVFDRHILHELSLYPDPATVSERFRNGYVRLLRMTCRRPDLTVLLHADPATLLARKGETDARYLRERNEGWRDQIENDASATIIDATTPLDEVYASVRRLVLSQVGGSRPTDRTNPTVHAK